MKTNAQIKPKEVFASPLENKLNKVLDKSSNRYFSSAYDLKTYLGVTGFNPQTQEGWN